MIRKIKYPLLAIIIVFLLSLSTLVGIYTDFLWFKALEYQDVFLKIISTKIILFFVVGLFFLGVIGLNIYIASYYSSMKKWASRITIAISSFIALLMGVFGASYWKTYLLYFNQTLFNLQDPILMKDVSFYIFSLPFYNALWSIVFITTIITLIIITLYYFQQFIFSLFNQEVDPHTNTYKEFNLFKEFKKIHREKLVHIAILGSIVFILLAIKNYLQRYSVMFSEAGIVVGAGYTDVHIFLPVIKIMMILAIIIAVIFYIWIFYFSKEPKLRKRHIILFLIGLYIVFAVVGEFIVPSVVQSLVVSPNEINLEAPYIDNNIKFTRIAYGLDDVDESFFNLNQTLSKEMLDQEKHTIDNVRILDYRPLTQTYKQTQEIRLYYDLADVDIDRYQINGDYTQVLLSARELDQNQIASNAQTWVNLHMVYTHGFGAVMSPVNEVTSEGLPYYLIKDIPPITDYETLKIDQPRIYYGEKFSNFVLTNTKTKEFDYPKGNTNEYIHYDGKGGIKLDSTLKKLGIAFRFRDVKLLLSSEITDESKIMFDRNIQKRINKITPFLMLDYDPYLVIKDGKLYWIQDAYTTSNRFPYSEKRGNINYIRNAVKVVVDAYNGDVTYYIADEDPILQTYAKIFPNLFKSFDEMPLKDHIRYPEDMFKIQSSIYADYHMNDTKVFYNKEDAWQIPYEIYGTSEQTVMEPFYMILKLPGETKEEFVLLRTYTPLKKDNMIAWFAARCDKENYGKLVLYKFPKDQLIYGPLQIEAKIDQDSEISQQLTLWSQQGSRVTRGNLLVIPIQNSLLYIEPLYLQAEKGQLPQLKRVIVSDGEKVVMETSLDKALSVILGKEVRSETKTPLGTTESASEVYDRILDAMQKGNWEEFGNSFEKLGRIIENMG